MGYQARPMPGQQRTTVGLVGNDGRVDGSRLAALPGVQEIIHVTKPYKQVSREWKPEPTIVRLPGGLTIGGDDVVVMAGPCSVESERQILDAARAVRDGRRDHAPRRRLQAADLALLLPGTGPSGSPAAGPGARGDRAADRHRGHGCRRARPGGRGGGHRADRRPQHAELLPARSTPAGCGKPVLLKRGLSATIQELLLSAEYILAEGNPDVILCERGVRGFDTTTRNLFDLSAIPVVHGLSHLPIVADPSHGTGHRDMVIPMARAAVAAGADGLLVEVHPTPDRALSDGAQSLYPEQFERLMRETRIIAEAIGRRHRGARGSTRVKLLVACWLLGLVVAANASRRRTRTSIVGRSSRVYRSLSSLTADFVQVIDNPMIDSAESRGTLVQAGSAKLSMRFTDPPGEAIVIDGEHVWVYTPSTMPGQVLRTDRAERRTGLRLQRAGLAPRSADRALRGEVPAGGQGGKPRRGRGRARRPPCPTCRSSAPSSGSTARMGCRAGSRSPSGAGRSGR